MKFAIWAPDNLIAAEAKIRKRRISERPFACVRGKCTDFFGGGGQARAGEGNCLGVCRDDLFRRRRDEDGERRPFGAAVYLDGGLLDLVNRQRPRSHEVQQNADAAGNVTTAILPAPDAPRTDVEQLGDAVLRSERAECFAEFDRGLWQVAGHNDVAADDRLMRRSR